MNTTMLKALGEPDRKQLCEQEPWLENHQTETRNKVKSFPVTSARVPQSLCAAPAGGPGQLFPHFNQTALSALLLTSHWCVLRNAPTANNWKSWDLRATLVVGADRNVFMMCFLKKKPSSGSRGLERGGVTPLQAATRCFCSGLTGWFQF